MASASLAYISTGCNRSSNAADISPEGLVAYGAGRLVALWDPNDPIRRGVHTTLTGHSSDICTVKWLHAGTRGSAIVSGSADGMVRVWRAGAEGKWRTSALLQGHTKSISALGVLRAPHVRTDKGELVVIGSSDGSLRVWNLKAAGEQDEVELVQTINLNGRFPLDIALTYLPESDTIIMALGSTDRRIEIWVQSENQFSSALMLEGHEDWVRVLSFATLPPTYSTPTKVVLASGSQDAYVRLWEIKPFVPSASRPAPAVEAETPRGELSVGMLDEFERRLREGDADAGDEVGSTRQISTKAHVLVVKNADGTSKQFSLNFEALLLGHDSWITGLHWHPAVPSPSSSPSTTSYTQPLLLLSSSADKSLILWSPSSGLWTNHRRFGEFGTGGLGTFGGLWGPSGEEVFAHGLGGSFHRWRRDGKGEGLWDPEVGVTGHAAPVRDVCWDPRGEFFMSVSIDQTTRLHAPWKRDGTETWHELGRPQTHGYDVHALAFVGADSLQFASASDEKIVRVFQAPRGWVRTARNLGVSSAEVDETNRPVASNLPPLQLSNRVVGEDEETAPQDAADSADTSSWAARAMIGEGLHQPPVEEQLVTTLWPETNKLFGHGYELIAASSAHTRPLLATACKATSATHAVLRIFDVARAIAVGQPLPGHTLTVTRIRWSADDKLVLSVSRDRTWRLFEADGEGGFRPVAAEKAHARIVWDCAFAPDGEGFATASRDKTVKVWRRADPQSNAKWDCVATLKLAEAATAVDFAPEWASEKLVLAVGLENGEINIYSASRSEPADWRLDLRLDSSVAHVEHVYQVAWRRAHAPGAPRPDRLQLASCSEDRSVRVFDVVLP